jgi:hypothetical protein
MKLFIDDIRNAPDESWLVARTITSAIKALWQWEFEVVSIDHDISHQVGMGELSRPFPCPENFQPVAFYLREICRNGKKRPQVIIHTSNPVGADDIKRALQGEFNVEVKSYGAANRLEQEI